MSIWSRVRNVEGRVFALERLTDSVVAEYAAVLKTKRSALICLENMVTCESCGCAVVKGQECKGEAEIRYKRMKVNGPYGFVFSYDDMASDPYAHTPVYCKRCAGEKAKPKRSHHKDK
jgi:hypothetical protein